MALLSRIEPRCFYEMPFAPRDRPEYIARYAPGVTGTHKMPNDEALWHSVAPLFGALKAFDQRSRALSRQAHVAFTGASTER
jgi:hypothetical protein